MRTASPPAQMPKMSPISSDLWDTSRGRLLSLQAAGENRAGPRIRGERGTAYILYEPRGVSQAAQHVCTETPAPPHISALQNTCLPAASHSLCVPVSLHSCCSPVSSSSHFFSTISLPPHPTVNGGPSDPPSCSPGRGQKERTMHLECGEGISGWEPTVWEQGQSHTAGSTLSPPQERGQTGTQSCAQHPSLP